MTVEKDWQTVEVTVKDKGFTSRAEKSADRMEDAFDAAVDLLTRRIVVADRLRLSRGRAENASGRQRAVHSLYAPHARAGLPAEHAL